LKNQAAISGELHVLTRSIDIVDPFDLSFEEKIFDKAKRVCVGFAIAALAISGLDLLNVRPLESTAEFIQAHRNAQLAEWPALIRSGIQQISLSVPPSAVVAIPSDFALRQAAPRPVLASARRESPVAQLAAARHEDAIELAMNEPQAFAKASAADMTAQQPAERHDEVVAAAPVQPFVSQPPPATTTPPSANVTLASVDPAVMPQTSAPAVLPVSLPATLAVLPLPAPGAPPLSPAQRLHLEGKERAKAEHCLANAVYFEARDQPYKGQVAVAQVVMNRVFSGVYPRDVCGVIYQNANRHLGCQFTFACDGKRKTISEFGAWARARRIARETLDGQLYVPAVGTSTHYHATYVHPNWVHEMHRLAREGIHLFYRPIAWGNGSDEPVWSREQLASYRRLASDEKKKKN
jgi:spore germination cell wall hydrolase CwlJ-like protein